MLAACASMPERTVEYPPARRADVVDDYFGTKVADPWRWLEDADSAETRAWVAAQNALSQPLLARLPGREAIRERLAALWSHERHSPPRTTPAGALVYTRHDGRTDQPVLMIQDAPAAMPRVLIDPNSWSADGADAMAHWTLSPDGLHVLYAVQTGGSDWVEYRLLEIASGRVLPDRVRGVNFNFDAARIAWNGGSKGFFYSRFPAPNAAVGAPPTVTHARLYYHALGTDQSRDTLVHERPDQPGWFIWGEPTDDGRYTVIYVERTEDSEKQVLVRDLRRGGPSRPIVTNWKGKYYLVGSDGPLLFFRTSAGASRYRILACDLRQRGRAAWREIVPESVDVLLDARLLGGEIVASYLHDAAARLHRYAPDGRSLGAIPLPGPGTVKDLRGDASAVIHFSFESFSRPSTVYRHDLVRGEQAAFHPPTLAFRAEDYVTEQVFFASKDGTRVPMFVSRRRDAPSGPAPTLLYGYGGFANPLTPSFNVAHLVWMERGGVFAQVSLRGGTEYGEAWHEGGMLAHKQNVFDDFIAAGEHLVRSGITTPAQLAARGRSNGGLLVGAVLNQRPDLFGAAHAAVGVLDMLRYHRFGIAYAWAGDYGRSDDPAMFPVLRAYSPVHNTRAGTRYPAVLVTTAERDDRVHPLHSFKYTAALQAAQGGERPVLIRVETRAGHGAGGAGTPLSKQIEENADVLAFLERYTRD
ncbi:MAG TPA: prolyl oligopeptidase family serine peptidase [Verrucomicrobiae bacterium]|nr:prolyl oligopeptidase family serine peptidase [Verrucomicrobiae bacterium]